MSGGKSDYLELRVLDLIYGATALAAPATLYVGLLTDTNTQAQRDAGTLTEVTGNGYARVAVTNNATNWPAAAAGQKQNGTAITFPTPTPAGWGVVTAFGVWDALTAGNLLYWGDLLGTEKTLIVDPADLTANLIDSPAHGLVAGDKIKVSSISGTTLPAGLTDGAYYFVLATGLTADKFSVSLTSGGVAVDITGGGGGKWGKTQEQTISANNPPSFAVNQLTIQED